MVYRSCEMIRGKIFGRYHLSRLALGMAGSLSRLRDDSRSAPLAASGLGDPLGCARRAQGQEAGADAWTGPVRGGTDCKQIHTEVLPQVRTSHPPESLSRKNSAQTAQFLEAQTRKVTPLTNKTQEWESRHRFHLCQIRCITLSGRDHSNI
jgi:hypothetical protein